MKMILLFAVLALPASSAFSEPKAVDGVLTDARGMTLYVWNNDTVPGKSQCEGVCSLTWPPALAEDTDKAAGDYTLIVREDGKRQWAYKGKPLYGFANDGRPGDRTGDGFRAGMWNAARP